MPIDSLAQVPEFRCCSYSIFTGTLDNSDPT
jgi:hypothetical protein